MTNQNYKLFSKQYPFKWLSTQWLEKITLKYKNESIFLVLHLKTSKMNE